MSRYRKILVAFDGSPSSQNALRYALELAKREKSWVKALAIVPDFEGDLDLTAVKDIEEALRGCAERLMLEARAIAKDCGASVLADYEQGEPFERIIGVAQSELCDLIVMGRRGTQALERVLLGSVAQRVIGYGDKDVLVVPKDCEPGLGHLLVALDGSPSSELASERAIEIARDYGAAVTAVSVVHTDPELYAEAPNVIDKLVLKARKILEQFASKAQAQGIKPDLLVKEGEPYTKVVEAAAELGAGLIIMGSRGRTGAVRLLLGSVAERVIGTAHCPVLVVR